MAFPFPKIKTKNMTVFACPALVGYGNFCESRRPCLQPSPGARSLLKSEGCRCEVEVCHEDYRGSSDLNKYLSSFHKRKRNRTMWKTSEWAQSTVTSPAYKVVCSSYAAAVSGAVESSPRPAKENCSALLRAPKNPLAACKTFSHTFAWCL